MQSMAQQDGGLSDDNVHVKELKRLFNSCNSDRNGLIDKDGLILLCEKLNLSDFAGSIVDRVLCNDIAINFKQFKDRFLSFLPEIIDLASGNQDELLISAYKSCSSLGIKDTRRLSRYDVHAICESTSELDLLSVVDINSIFDKSSIAGRVSLMEFITQYRTRQKMSEEIHFIAETYRMSSVNLFEHLDTNNTGEADHSTVIEYLTTSGLKLEEAISLLKDYGQSTSSMVGLVGLGNYLESSLSHFMSSSTTSSRAAVFCMKSLIENYRCTVREYELRCEHMQKQIHIANQRRTMLIEELDQNQQSIEASYNNRLKEMEDRCRSRIAVMEEKFRTERSELQKEIETIEKDLSFVRHNETSLKNKLQLVERHNKRISAEMEEQAETISSTEKENQQLRADLRKKLQFRASEDNSQKMIWKQKVEVLVAHNKRLRDKLRDASKKSKYSNNADPDSFVQWTAPFRGQLLLIRKRRSAKGESLSEMESEPESIFYRRRRKRLHKRRDRMRRYETIHNLQTGQNGTEPTADTYSETGRKTILSPRNRDMLFNLKESDHKLISRAKVDDSKSQKSNTAAFEEILSANHYETEIRRLQTSITTQKQMYEGQILNLSRKLATFQHSETRDPNTSFFSLMEKYRAADAKSPTNAIGVEKNTVRNRFSSSFCSRCTVIEPKINELNSIIGGSVKNLTVEDPVPTATNQEKSFFQNELGRLKVRLKTVRSKVSEIVALMSLPISHTRHYLQQSESANLSVPRQQSYSARTHRSFADLRERTPLSERSESSKDSVADPSQFNISKVFQKQLA